MPVRAVAMFRQFRVAVAPTNKGGDARETSKMLSTVKCVRVHGVRDVPQRTTNIAGRQAATPSAASVETRSDNPASAMKVSATGAIFGRSMLVARRRDLQTVADPDTAGAADLYPAGCGPSGLASRGACLKPTWWRRHASQCQKKVSLYRGYF